MDNSLKTYLFFICLISAALISPPFIQGQIAQDGAPVLWPFFDEEVFTPTRYLKPITHVAENVEVFEAWQIEAMNAHTLAEVVARITGIFVNFGGRDYVSTSLLMSQGSDPRQVLVLLDGHRAAAEPGGSAKRGGQ